jgi:hypothetical protein
MLRRIVLAAAFSAAFAAGASAATINYTAKLSGAKEVPKTDSKGKGSLTATYDTVAKVLSYKLTVSGLTGPATGAHFHGPATRNESAGVVAPIGEKNPPAAVSGTVSLTDEQVKMLHAGKIYVNVHTEANPKGEIRGQVTRGTTHVQPVAKKPAA